MHTPMRLKFENLHQLATMVCSAHTNSVLLNDTSAQMEIEAFLNGRTTSNSGRRAGENMRDNDNGFYLMKRWIEASQHKISC